MEKKIIVISGPTGCGEGAITKELIHRYPGDIERIITATSRSMRSGEQEGIDYHFLGNKGFKDALARGDILEYGYISNRDTYYGTYRPQLERQLATGHILIANTQIVGTKFYKEHYGALAVFIMPGNMEELADRIRNRNPEMSDDELQRRLADAQREVDEEKYAYDHTVFNANGKLHEAVDQVLAIMRKSGYNV